MVSALRARATKARKTAVTPNAPSDWGNDQGAAIALHQTYTPVIAARTKKSELPPIAFKTPIPLALPIVEYR